MATDRRKSSLNKPAVTSILSRQQEEAIVNENATLDEQALGALGYKQEFKRYESNFLHFPLLDVFNCRNAGHNSSD